MDTYHWDVLVMYQWDVVKCFIWDLFETSWRRTDETLLLRPLETSPQRSNKMSWRRTTEMSWWRSIETSLGVSIETFLRSFSDEQRDIGRTSLRRLFAGWRKTNLKPVSLLTLHEKWTFPLTFLQQMWPNLQETVSCCYQLAQPYWCLMTFLLTK